MKQQEKECRSHLFTLPLTLFFGKNTVVPPAVPTTVNLPCPTYQSQTSVSLPHQENTISHLPTTFTGRTADLLTCMWDKPHPKHYLPAPCTCGKIGVKNMYTGTWGKMDPGGDSPGTYLVVQELNQQCWDGRTVMPAGAYLNISNHCSLGTPFSKVHSARQKMDFSFKYSSGASVGIEPRTL